MVLFHMSICRIVTGQNMTMDKMQNHIGMPSQDIDMLNSISMLQDNMHHVSDHVPVMTVIGSPTIFFILPVDQ